MAADSAIKVAGASDDVTGTMSRRHLYRKAFCDYAPLLSLGGIYALCVMGEALYLGAPLWQILLYAAINLGALFFMAVLCLLLFYLLRLCYLFLSTTGGVRARAGAADAAIERDVEAFFSGPQIPYGMAGFLVFFANSFFAVQKSMMPTVVDYKLDPWLASMDRWLHLGVYPHVSVIDIVNKLDAASFLDGVYVVWFPVMILSAAYVLFIERDIGRKLQFLWVWILSWLFLGVAMATASASVGPLFLHDFYPDIVDPYADLVANFDKVAAAGDLVMQKTREGLIEWTTNDRLLDPNALSAMPSMHIALCWLLVLYAWSVGRFAFSGALVYCCLVFLSTVYFGVHYALDAYVSVAGVSLIWWIAGRMLQKQKPGAI